MVETGLAKACHITTHTDSSAAKSMASRFGTTRKTRHIDLRFLYLQHLVKHGTVRILKISGEQNIADVLTKYVSSEILKRHMEKLGLVDSKEYWHEMD
jgi:hypothetical protein